MLKELLDSKGTLWLIEKKYVSAVCQNPHGKTQTIVHVVGVDGPIIVKGSQSEVMKTLGLPVPKKAATPKKVATPVNHGQ